MRTDAREILGEFDLRPFVISAPFGNYIHHFRNASSTFGTFTPLPRKGVIPQILKTVRPVFTHKGGWVNAIGLRNPSILAAKNPKSARHIISIAALESGDWGTHAASVRALLSQGFHFGALELNLSCPNAKLLNLEQDEYLELAKLKPIIAKLSPRYGALGVGERLYDYGVRIFHLTNTLKTPRGGLSGPSLRSHALLQVERFRKRFGRHIVIIGGGGVQGPRDVRAFQGAGADSVALGSVFFTPWRLWRLYPFLLHRPKT